jgi:hypothetical protein
MRKIFASVLLLQLLLLPMVAGEPLPVSEREKPGLVGKILWYLPNRVLDLMDIFRVRAKVGPGLEVGARFTDAFSFYGGASHSVYAGLPGPRNDPEWPAFLGLQHQKGMVLMGVDATDVMPYPPEYEYSEIGLSAHLLLVGADIGVSPVEFFDFLAGWFGVDVRDDDFPRKRSAPPQPGSMLNPDRVGLTYPLAPKPDQFNGMPQRLNYLQENVPLRLQGQMHFLDSNLSGEDSGKYQQPPVTDFRLELFYDMISGPNGSMGIDPTLKINVELPNFEKKLNVFVQSSYDDDLPGLDQINKQDKGWSVGFGRQMDRWNLSTDVGIHTKWEPELFLRFSWRPHWTWDEWFFGFEQRVFWENEDQFGSLTSLTSYIWLGDADTWVFRNVTAGRITEISNGFEWQQTVGFGCPTSLRDESKRGKNLSINDALAGYAAKASIFGEDERITTYRSTLVYRHRLHEDFVVMEVEPGLEWRDEHDWTTQYRFSVGVLLFF